MKIMKFEINLMSKTGDLKVLKVYNTITIPVVGDRLTLAEDKIFVVRERILPTVDIVSIMRVVLLGDVIEN